MSIENNKRKKESVSNGMNQQGIKMPSRKWITFPEDGKPHIVVFRKKISTEHQQQITFDYTADERCQIFLDGRLIADGPERGSELYWYKQSVKISLSPGKHCLCVRLLISAVCQNTSKIRTLSLR